MLKKLIPWLLIIAGCVIISIAVFDRIETWKNQAELVRQYNLYIKQLKDKGDNPEDSASPLEEEPGIQELPPVLVNPDEPGNNIAGEETSKKPELIGIMSIPKINLTVAIGEGTDPYTLRYTVGHFKETSKPGKKGNFSVIGHRSYRYGQFFNRLDQLEEGDAIIVESGIHTYTYKVTESFVVNPEDTWVLNDTDDAQITLITCTPIRVATHRLIVRGILEKTE